MRKMAILSVLVLVAAGCSIKPAERSSREQALKVAADAFILAVTRDDWSGAFAMTDAGFQGADELKDHLKKSWVQDGVLTGGVVSSMAWITDDTAKVKINWSFQTGTVPSYSSETFVWRWKDKSWKYEGRVLR